ncbi:hypothetical protein FRC98_13325 [Lujinxingia vulgaris]|uniref:Uncharacterized protein n=1 Tax=Lujinxingia vulgaris TaxID=2600176 RepID=A0A5C6X8M6_9DELT|nr:hypothetical protein [Lujinxingia vulgaris]TXD36101.1 hypothetical protein FRC98_13325 [Lujinxingia vulgaris]
MNERRAGVLAHAVGALLLLVMLAGAGCEGCQPPAPPTGQEGALMLGEMIPQTAQVVVFAEELAALESALGGMMDRAPVVGEALEGVVSGEVWSSMGAGQRLPAVGYLAHGQVVLAGWREPGVDVEAARTLWGFEARGFEVEGAEHALRLHDAEGALKGWAVMDARRWAVGWFVGEEAKTSLDEVVLGLGERALEVGAHRRFLTTSQARPISAMISAGRLAEGLSGEGQAGVLAQRMARELGWVHLRAGLDATRRKVELEVGTPGVSGVATSIEDLGEAAGDIPPVGGLVRPGVLGAVRISASPERFVEFVRGTLSAEDRQRLDQWIEELNEELRVDVMGDVVGQLTGQALVVIYGLESSFFEQEGIAALATLVRLKSTRDAVLLPIKERRPVEDMLNSLTQVSRGKLQRQVIRHMIQYAWIEDGELKWALILGDDHVLLVDSAVAFDHANRWERSPQTEGGLMEGRELEGMLAGRSGGGIYVELGALRGIFEEKGPEDLARWLEPFEAVKVRAGVGDRVDRAQVVLWLEDAWAGGEPEARVDETLPPATGDEEPK